MLEVIGGRDAQSDARGSLESIRSERALLGKCLHVAYKGGKSVRTCAQLSLPLV